jgi:hypothetical protein
VCVLLLLPSSWAYAPSQAHRPTDPLPSAANSREKPPAFGFFISLINCKKKCITESESKTESARRLSSLRHLSFERATRSLSEIAAGVHNMAIVLRAPFRFFHRHVCRGNLLAAYIDCFALKEAFADLLFFVYADKRMRSRRRINECMQYSL